MTPVPRHKLSARTDRLLSAAILGLTFLWLLTAWSGIWNLDMSAVYYAARSWGMGQPDLIFMSQPEFFGTSASIEWQDMAAAQGHPGTVILPYIYPPIWAALLSPVATAMGPQSFFNLTTGLQILALLAAVPAAWRIAGKDRMPLWLWCALSAALMMFTSPFFFAFLLNQPQITVTALTLIAFALYARGQGTSAGVVLGLAAAIKVLPVVLALIFLMDRAWRPLFVTLGVAGGFALASLLIAGWDMHWALIDQMGRATDKIVVGNVNFGLEAVLIQIFDADAVRQAWNQEIVAAIIPPWAYGGFIPALILIGGVVLSWRVPAPGPNRLWVRLFCLSILLAMCGPLGWVHYLILPVLLLPAVALFTPIIPGVVLVAAFAVLISEPFFFAMVEDQGPAAWVAVITAFWAVSAISAVLWLSRKAQPSH